MFEERGHLNSLSIFRDILEQFLIGDNRYNKYMEFKMTNIMTRHLIIIKAGKHNFGASF